MSFYKYIVTGLVILGLFLKIGISDERDGFYYKEIVETADLYGIWGTTANNEDVVLLNISVLGRNGEGLDLYILKDSKDSFKLNQRYRWEFQEEEQIYTQHIQKITITTNGTVEEEFPNSSNSANIRVMMLDNDIIGITFDDESGESTSLWKIPEEQFKEILHEIEMSDGVDLF
ncbi:hypothetical protein [Ignatzschineria sp. LJL83]